MPENKKQSESKQDDFIAITVHEMKTPLAAMRWSLEVLSDLKLEDRYQKLIEGMQDSTQRMLVLVKDMLNLESIQKGEFNIAVKSAKLSPLIDQVLSELSQQIRGKKLKLIWHSPKPDLVVEADGMRTTQVVMNLLSNAIKYTAEGGEVEIKVKESDIVAPKEFYPKAESVADGYAHIMVRDTGIGIPIDQQKRLFTKFFRAESVLKTDIEGTGLGLFIVRSIVEKHKGRIWFTSKPDKGSEFIFSIPLAKK